MLLYVGYIFSFISSLLTYYNQFYCLLSAIAGDGDIIDAIGGEMAIVSIMRERLGGGVLLDDAAIGIDDADVDDVVVGLGDTEGVVAGRRIGRNGECVIA